MKILFRKILYEEDIRIQKILIYIWKENINRLDSDVKGVAEEKTPLYMKRLYRHKFAEYQEIFVSSLTHSIFNS